MLRNLYSRLHCLVGLLVLVSLAGCETTTTASRPTVLEEYEAYKLRNAGWIIDNRASCGVAIQVQADQSVNDLRALLQSSPYASGFLYFQCDHQSTLDTTLVHRCNESKGTTDCIMVLKEDFGGELQDYVSVNLRRLRANQSHVQQQQEMQARSNTCKSFGFKENTETHAQCMFDLFKLEQSAAQNQALQSQAASESAAQRALLQQQLDQQEFNQGIELMQQGLDIMNPPRPTTTCQWNDIMQTMTCR